MLVVVFLVLPAIRPYIRSLQSQDGLVWFPLMALAIGAGLFPAYGFRPECVPLLLCTVFLNIRHVPLLLDHLGWWNRDTIPRQSFTMVWVGFLILTAAMALYFSPRRDTRLTFSGVKTHTIRDEARDADIFLRLYGPLEPDTPGASPARPLMLLVPPVFGSVGMVDQVCGKLRDQGFTVLSFSRRGFDFPAWGAEGKRYGPPVQERFRIFQAFAQGNATAGANRRGRALEAGRMDDIRFLLSYIRQGLYRDFPESGADQNTLFLAGYDAGGSALALLGTSPEWRAANPAVKGLILVESPLWSVYEFADPEHPPKVKSLIRPQVPALFMTSDRINDPQKRNRPYGPLLQILETDTPVVLAAVDGAGPLDYSDCPAKYPLYSACISGNKQAQWKYDVFIEGTASIMTNFASLLLEHAPTSPRVSLSRRKGLGGTIHFETGGAWNLPDFGYILSP